jgi:hypothetical protein
VLPDEDVVIDSWLCAGICETKDKESYKKKEADSHHTTVLHGYLYCEPGDCPAGWTTEPTRIKTGHVAHSCRYLVSELLKTYFKLIGDFNIKKRECVYMWARGYR